MIAFCVIFFVALIFAVVLFFAGGPSEFDDDYDMRGY